MDWQNHRPDCKRKMQQNASAPTITSQPSPGFSNSGLEMQEQSANPLGITQDELDCYLGEVAAANDYSINNNFDIMSDSVENLLQQQEQIIPLFDNTTTTMANTDENGMVRDFGMLDDLLFSSTTDFDLAGSTTEFDTQTAAAASTTAATTNDIADHHSQFGIGGEMMPLTNNDIFPELNMQFSDPAIEQFGVEEMCESLLKDMNEYGVCVIDNFLGYDKGLGVLKEVNDMYSAGVFKVRVLKIKVEFLVIFFLV